jgi:hypothetical protein
VISLHFIDQHHQLISLSLDRHIILWDTNKLSPLQSFTDYPFPNGSYSASAAITSNSSYCELIVGMKQLKRFRLVVDEGIELDQ